MGGHLSLSQGGGTYTELGGPVTQVTVDSHPGLYLATGSPLPLMVSAVLSGQIDGLSPLMVSAH